MNVRALGALVVAAAMMLPAPGAATVGVPAGATVIAPAEWASLSASGQLGAAISGPGVPHPAAAAEHPETVPDADGKPTEITFQNEADNASELVAARSRFATVQNQLRIYRALEPLANAASASHPDDAKIAAMTAAQLTALNRQLVGVIVPKANLTPPATWHAPPASGDGCGDGVLGIGDRGDLGTVTAHTYSPVGIHENFDWPLKPFLPCVKNQAKRGTCTQFAALAAVEELVAEKYGTWVDLSEQATAAQDKIFWKPALTGTESVQRTFSNSETGYLIPFENAWDYNGAHDRVMSTSGVGSVAGNGGLTGACTGYAEYCSDTSGEGKYVCAHLSGGLSCAFATQVKSHHSGVRVLSWGTVFDKTSPTKGFDTARALLALGYPMIFGGSTKDKFSPPHAGYLRAPRQGNYIGDLHAYNVVGYISAAQMRAKLPHEPRPSGGGYFIVRNSWGLGYGDRGFAYMPVAWAKKYVNNITTVFDVDLTQ